MPDWCCMKGMVKCHQTWDGSVQPLFSNSCMHYDAEELCVCPDKHAVILSRVSEKWSHNDQILQYCHSSKILYGLQDGHYYFSCRGNNLIFVYGVGEFYIYMPQTNICFLSHNDVPMTRHQWQLGKHRLPVYIMPEVPDTSAISAISFQVSACMGSISRTLSYTQAFLG